MNLEHVLIGFDFSEASYTAFWHASRVAHALARRLTLLHVDELPSMVVAQDPERRFVGRRRRRLLDDLAQLARASSVDARPLLTTGAPAAALLEAARTGDADLIVVGRRDLGRLRRWISGSVCERVVAQATRPVLVVPEHAEVDALRGPTEPPYRHVLLATDLKAPSTRALGAVLELTERMNARLTLVNVLGHVPGVALTGQPYVSGLEPSFGQLERATRSRLRRMLNQRDPGGQARARIVAGGLVGRTLLHVAEEIAADLLVVPHRDHGFVERLLGSATTRGLVRRSPVAVLALSPAALEHMLGHSASERRDDDLTGVAA